MYVPRPPSSPSAETGELLEDEFVTEDMEFEPNFDDSAYESFSSAGEGGRG